jgi:large subunit ribosomal protein L30
MLTQVNDYVTWGEVDKKTLKKLLKKRGRLTGEAALSNGYVKENIGYNTIGDFADSLLKCESKISDLKGLKPVFRLNPPLGGHARKGIKQPVSLGGSLGYRGRKINKLLEAML